MRIHFQQVLMPVRSHWNIISPNDRLSHRFTPFIAHKNLKQDTAVIFIIADNKFLCVTNQNDSYGLHLCSLYRLSVS